MVRTIVLLVALAACGSNKPIFAPADEHEHDKGSGSGSGSAAAANEAAAKQAEMATMPPAVKKFHDLLANATCATVPQLHTGADDIAKATPPTTANADTWTRATKALVAAVAGLDPACQSNDQSQIAAAFGNVHNAFQALLAAAGGDQHETK